MDASWKPLILVITLTVSVTNGLKPPTVESCKHHWLKMTDSNYNKAIKRYEDCAALRSKLSLAEALEYKQKLIKNLQRTSNYFFERTNLEPIQVVRVLRSVTKMVAGLEGTCPAEDATEKSNAENEGCDCEDATSRIKFFFIAFLLLIALQIILILILIFIICCTSLIGIKSNDISHECSCADDPEWLAQLFCEDITTKPLHDTFPLLIDSPRAADYGTNFGRRKSKDEEILTDLTSMSSSMVGSDSEFEALMKRRPLSNRK